MIKKQKDDIREEYKERRRNMPEEEKFRRDEAICKPAVHVAHCGETGLQGIIVGHDRPAD